MAREAHTKKLPRTQHKLRDAAQKDQMQRQPAQGPDTRRDMHDGRHRPRHQHRYAGEEEHP